MSNISFTQMTDKLPYPKKVKAKLSTLHSEVIGYVIQHFQNTNLYKTRIVFVMNILSYMIIMGDTIPQSWLPIKSLDVIKHPEIDNDDLERALGDLYIHPQNIEWDIEESETDEPIQPKPHRGEVKAVKKSDIPTPKEDLYIKSPIFPMFDVTNPWLKAEKDGDEYVIYTSLPIIPRNQRDISVTTNVDLMMKSDLLNLYPNRFIRTRSTIMYEQNNDLPFDIQLGIILPIEGFTHKQVRENIIKYPHFYQLKRKINNNFVSFYSNIEIDGILYNTLEVWDSLPDSKLIPKTTEFIKEYVVRRYLLERDIKNIKHKFPMHGSLDPFLTLFTTPADYISYGFTYTEDTARKHVISRVQYFRTRNPIIRKVFELP